MKSKWSGSSRPDATGGLGPEFRYILAYRSLFDVERFEEGDVLSEEEILPGFFPPDLGSLPELACLGQHLEICANI